MIGGGEPFTPEPWAHDAPRLLTADRVAAAARVAAATRFFAATPFTSPARHYDPAELTLTGPAPMPLSLS